MSFFEMQYLHIFMQTWIKPISMHLYYHCLHSVDVIVIMNEPRYVNLGFAKSLFSAARMMNMMVFVRITTDMSLFEASEDYS